MSCERVSDRMPVVAAGGQWTADEAAHLASCPDCATEWQLVQAARRLGQRLALDPDRIAERVRTRLETQPAVVQIRRSRALRWAAGLAAAAVLFLAVRIGVVERPMETSASDSVPVELVLTELDDLTSSELDSVFVELETDEIPVPALGISGFNDLTPEELERVLRDWES